MLKTTQSIIKDDPYLIDYILGWSGHQPECPWGAAASFALEVASMYGVIIGESNNALTEHGKQVAEELFNARVPRTA